MDGILERWNGIFNRTMTTPHLLRRSVIFYDDASSSTSMLHLLRRRFIYVDASSLTSFAHKLCLPFLLPMGLILSTMICVDYHTITILVIKNAPVFSLRISSFFHQNLKNYMSFVERIQINYLDSASASHSLFPF